MKEMVSVVLVPKTTSGKSMFVPSTEISPQSAKQLAPDRGRAAEALRVARGLNLDAQQTPRAGVRALVPRQRIPEVFRAELREARRPAHPPRWFSRERYLTCSGTLGVPDSLQDTIDFAYIPTPPEFFAWTPVAPSAEVFHLRLKDVQAVVGAAKCHRRGWTGEGITVAMTDTGFAQHPYFEQQGFRIERAATMPDLNPDEDAVGHGTGVSANLFATAPDCTLLGVRLEEFTAEALEVARTQNREVKIISNSWGYPVDRCSKEELKERGPEDFKQLRHLEWEINDAVDDGVLVVFSAGNRDSRMFPSSMPNVLSVGGVTVYQDMRRVASEFASSFESQLFPGRRVPDVCGVVGEKSKQGHILLPVPERSSWEGKNLRRKHRHCGWGIFSGTSAAAPQVAGVAALMLSINPELTPAELIHTIERTATDVKQGRTASDNVAEAGGDLATGAGLINAWEACLKVDAGRPSGHGWG